jgi:hypothetical protein
MIGHMFLMHELRGILGAHYLKFGMALTTFPLRDMAIPSNDIEMTLLASHPSRNILPMIKIPTLDFDISLRFDVARGTTPYGTGNAFLLPFGSCMVKMANKTVGLMNG